MVHVVSSHSFAGMELHVLRLVSELREMDCDASIACRFGAKALLREASAAGIPTRSWISAVNRRPDIVHAHDGRAAMLARLIATSRKVVFVRTQHFVLPASAMREGWRRSRSMLLHRQLNRRVDGYIAVSEAAKSAAIERCETGRARLAVIPPGIRLPSANAVAAARASRAQAATSAVAAAGRLERERRFNVLLEAAPEVRRARTQCRFVIAGSGSAEAELKLLARKLGVDDAVTWTGWLPSIEPVLMQSHVYVNTWPWEGFGMATAEAMAFALPVIAVDSGASTELVEDGSTGRLVPPDDPQALATAISQLIEDSSKAAEMGDRGRERAMKYSIQRTAATTMAFYRELHRVRHGL